MVFMYASIVVPTYNRRKTLERTLNALLSQTVSSDAFEIIVVDDCSSDNTQAYMKCMAELVSNLTYIRHGENQGRTLTRNDGIRATRGDIVIFLDDDNVPDQYFVEAHLRYHKQNGDEHIAVMGNIRFAPEVIDGSNFARYQQSRYLGCRAPRDRAGLDYSNLPPRCFGSGTSSARRADLLVVGMFDASFRYYGGEDEDLGYRLRQLGVRIMFGAEARALHYDDVSLLCYKTKIMESAREGLMILLAKSPEYFEGTQVRFLLPIDWKKDSIRRIVIKLSIRACLNPVTVFLFERWAILTDRCSWCYFQPLYRLLLAGWILQGQRSKQRGTKLVTYGADRAGQ